MHGQIPVRQPAADEGGPLALAKDFLIPHNLWLESLTWENTGADTAFLQIFNTPRRLAVAFTSTDATADTITAPAHGFAPGDAVRVTGVTGLSPTNTKYVSVVDADSIKVHGARALALAGGDAFDITLNESGSITLASDYVAAPLYEEYPVLGSASAPSNIGSYTNANFSRGLWVRAVTAAGGSTLVGSAVIRFTPRYLSGPLAGTPAYED